MFKLLSRLGFFALVAASVLSMAVLVVAQTNSKSDSNKSEVEKLFDGKSLNGWDGDKKIWKVVDGAIVGETSNDYKLKQNSFLIYKGDQLEDFELTIKFRISGERANSGIQFRSTDRGDFSVGGYQSDIDITGRFNGILYEERGRGILAQRGKKVVIDENGKKEVSDLDFDEEKFKASVKMDQWNEYTISAKGNHIVQKINGITTVDLTDKQAEKASMKGILALQIHVGPPMKVEFKDIALKRMKTE